VIGRLDTTIGPIKQRRRGHTAGQMLVGIAAAQLAGEDFLVGLDRQRADGVGQQLCPVPDLAATTAAGLARRLSAGQWTRAPIRPTILTSPAPAALDPLTSGQTRSDFDFLSKGQAAPQLTRQHFRSSGR
jgi:hypothetical protein